MLTKGLSMFAKMAERTSILLVNFSSGWGGGELWFLSVGKMLLEKGFEVRWWVREGSILEEKIQAEGLIHMTSTGRASDLLNPLHIRKLKKQVKAFAPDIVLLNASHELKLGGLVCKLAGVPHIVFRRGVSYPIGLNSVNRWFMGKVANAFLANGQTTFRNVTTAFPVIHDFPSAIIPNGISLKRFENWEATPVKGRIVMSARLSAEKGIDRALRVMALLRTQFPEAHLHILGTGPELTRLQEQAMSLGIEDIVHFKGFVDDVLHELKQASVFLFTPLKGEGTSFALLEAMAAELPCLAFESPSLDEVIIDDETGYLLAPNDERGMAHRLHKVLKDNALRQRMGAAGRRRAFEHFSIERLVSQLLDFFKILLR